MTTRWWQDKDNLLLMERWLKSHGLEQVVEHMLDRPWEYKDALLAAKKWAGHD